MLALVDLMIIQRWFTFYWNTLYMGASEVIIFTNSTAMLLEVYCDATV